MKTQIIESGHRLIVALIRIYEWVVYYLVKLVVFSVAKNQVICMLTRAGIVVNGEKKPKLGDIKIYNENFYPRLAAFRSLGLGESYMESWWDTSNLEEFFYKILTSDVHKEMTNAWARFLDYLQFNLINLQTEARSWEIGKVHYDCNNTILEAMLGPSMNYSNGYWKEATDLESAQLKKMELIGEKLKLKPGMRVLDLGCGWGALCKFLAQKYQVTVVGLTNNVEGVKFAQEFCEGLPVEIRVADYRDFTDSTLFDRVVTVEMLEHVGHKNYRTFFQVAHRNLKTDGLLLIQSSGVSHPHVPLMEAWESTYFSPNSIMPYHTQISEFSDGLFVLEDWQNLGYHYYKTVQAWISNFQAAWPTLKKNFEKPDKVYRMWMYRLSVVAALFRSRRAQSWQIVMSKDGFPGGYDAPR